MSKTPTKEMIEAVAWSASSQPGMPFGMILIDKDIENILTIGLANAPAALQSAEEAPPPSSHVVGSLWNQLVVLSGYHITQPPTPDHEFVQVCNGDLRKMVELMGSGSLPSSNTAGRWRAFEDTTPGYWGIELEDAGNDDDAILYPQKIHRDTVARIVEAHNASLATPSPQSHSDVLRAAADRWNRELSDFAPGDPERVWRIKARDAIRAALAATATEGGR